MPQNKHEVVILPWNCEIAQNHRDHEHIVHGQAFLDQESGQIGHAGLITEAAPDPKTKGQSDRNVASAKDQALSNLNLARLAVEHAEIEGEQQDHDADEAEPHPAWPAEQLAVEQRIERRRHRSHDGENRRPCRSCSRIDELVGMGNKIEEQLARSVHWRGPSAHRKLPARCRHRSRQAVRGARSTQRGSVDVERTRPRQAAGAIINRPGALWRRRVPHRSRRPPPERASSGS